MTSRASARALLTALLATGVAVASVALAAPQQAAAATTETYPATATADALPTVQVNGVVWDQAVIGNTVYAVGNFTAARPAGSAAGANTVARSNMLAYSLTTGALISSFAPTFNGQVQSVDASPDGTKLFVGGQFTSVSGVARNRVAMLNPTTGAVSTAFTVGANSTVYSVFATNTTLYIGGSFTSVGGGNARLRAAAFSIAGNSVLPFAPQVGDRSVRGISASGGKVAIGGNFTTVNGSDNPGYGLALLDGATGASLPMPANNSVRNGGDDAAVWSLNGDATGLYGTGYHFGGGGTAEGSFKVDWDGNLVWIDDCHGDTYDSANAGDVVYQVSHKHYCGNLGTGGFPQTSPDWSFYRGTATTNYATGVNKPDIYGYPDHDGEPSPTLLPFFPTINSGSFTGMSQGPWTVEVSGDYVLMGGEFTTVNGAGQQGLVRFAKRSVAPKQQGPRLSGNQMQPTVRSLTAGGVKVSWPGNWDRDDDTLTYKVQRTVNNQWTTVKEVTQRARFWEVQPMTFFDTGLAIGSNQTYRIQTSDPDGNTTTSATATVTVNGTGTLGAYGAAVQGDGATKYWRLDESDSAVVDWSGGDDRTAGSSATRSIDGALLNSTDTATRFDDSGNAVVVSGGQIQAPDTFSYEVWFRTTSASGGKIAGFGNAASGNSGSYDRHVYMDGSGTVRFGVWTGQGQNISSNAGYNDGAWHQAVATMGSGGMAFYLDGRLIGRNPTTTGQNYTGYWRIGGDSSWAGDTNFDGDIDEFSVYPTVLTRQQVDAHWVASGRPSTLSPRPADSYGRAVHDDQPELYWRLGEANGSTAADASDSQNSGTYSGDVTLGQEGVTGADTGVRLGNGSTVVASKPTDNPSTFSQEVWFKTTTTTGGRIFGFGNSSSAWFSNNYDRHLWMLDDGRVRFGTYNGNLNTMDSPTALNDGSWHHVVNEIGSDGMKMFVDGELVATNPNTQAQPYTGYWRLGGDNTWGGSSSNYFTGVVDEAAIYSTVLTAEQVKAHWVAGGHVPNTPPTAAFTAAQDDLKVSFDSTGSGDAEGAVSYAWDFGDGATSTEAKPEHTYATGGTKVVTLTVTDSAGAVATVSHSLNVIAPNVAPTASFGAAVSGLSVQFTDTSTDIDGTIASRLWEFGDGATSTEQNPSHTYADGAVRTVTLTVTDDRGGQRSTSQQVDPNAAPVASFTSAANGLAVQFTSTATDDAAVTEWAWDFGDTGAQHTSTDRDPAHTYAVAGTYTVSLTVKDAAGLSHSTTREVTVAPIPNKAPKAAFTSTASDATVSFDAAGSTDEDGTVDSYAWDFGDGSTGTGRTAQHTYTESKSYTVKLTVTDDDGATDSVTRTVEVQLPNRAPTAGFTSNADGATVSVDGAGSTDPDGTIASYAWQFGDGGTGTGRTAQHTYAASGTYSVKLTVTDNRGGTDSLTRSVQVTVPAGNPNTLAKDGFGRTVSNAWGTAETGGAWTVSGTAANWKVADGVGSMTLPAASTGRTALLNSVSSTDTAFSASFRFDKMATGGTQYVMFMPRAVNTSNNYRVKALIQTNGAVRLEISRVAGGTETSLGSTTVSGLTAAAGDTFQVSTRATGTSPTTISGKIWKKGSSEPTGWALERTDSTAGLQVAGGVGLYGYLGGGTSNVPVTVSIDDVLATSSTPPAANQPPVAGFTSTVSGATASFTSTATDPDGTIASRSWDFGDGTSSTEQNPSHTYQASGTYSVKLTVTDDKGATDSSTKQVTVTVPATPAALVKDAFGRSVGSGWGSADAGGAWTLSGSASNFSVGDGVGRIKAGSAGAGPRALLGGISKADTDATVTVKLDKVPTGGDTYVTLSSRRTGTSEYRLKARFQPTTTVIYLVKVVNGTETTLKSTTLASAKYADGDVFTLRLRTSGSDLSGKLWRVGSTEPASWQVQASDTAITAAGGTALQLYLSSGVTNAPVTASFDDLVVTEAQ